MTKVGDELIRPLLRALDDIPVHGRQLGDVPRGLKTTQRRNRDSVAGIDRLDVTVKSFRRNKKHDIGEYRRQLDEQMTALQGMSVADWRRNRSEYLAQGRTSDSLRAQQIARDAAFQEKYRALRRSNQGREEAMENAREWMKTQAATHRLDGIAGGDVTDISGVGDARINSSLGSQWRSRVGALDKAVDDFVAQNPDVDLSSVFMSIGFR